MPRHLHLDFETFSKADLKKVGAYRYAFDPTTEILCCAFALDNGKPVAWRMDMSEDEVWQLEPYFDALSDPETLIYAHNAQFEIAICQALCMKTWDVPAPAIERFRCTMSFARRAALPVSLEKLAESLGLTQLKDKKGKSLIQKFSVMQKGKKPSKKFPNGTDAFRLMPWDEPKLFDDFVNYCIQDVVVEQRVADKLSYFDDELNNRNYSITEIINSRGVRVNVPALLHAQKIVEEETEEVGKRFFDLVGFNFTQGEKFLEWLHSEGMHLDNLQAETIEQALAPFEGKENAGVAVQALRMKQSTAYASIKKIPTMISCVGPSDERIRGMLNHHGATTGRHTASLVQFQNMKRPTIKHSEEAYREICEGISREELEICYGPPLEVVSSCIRHFVHDTDGATEKPMLNADYAAVEGRIVNWLAGQEDAIEEYQNGVDRYKVMASVVYNIDVEKVNKHPQRFVGKQCILGCSYGMGASKFRQTCWNMGKYELPEGLEFQAIKAFRRKHNRIVDYWNDVEAAAKRAILNKGKMIEHRNIAFLHADIKGSPFLLLRLPSGRKLAYPRPRIEGKRITFYGNIKGTTWGSVDTYGGKLVENITQAVAADIMANGAWQAEQAGYKVLTLIHDEALAEYHEGQSVNEFVSLLTKLPDWAKGLPIEAEGGLVPFYKKD